MITMEKIDYVISATGKTYDEVRKALIYADGDVDVAIEVLKAKDTEVLDQEDEGKEDKKDFYDGEKIKDNVENLVDQVIAAIKEIWRKGNASRLVVENGEGRTVLSVRLNVSALAFVIEPLIAIIGLGATVITNYNIKIFMDDGDVIDVKEYIGAKK